MKLRQFHSFICRWCATAEGNTEKL